MALNHAADTHDQAPLRGVVLCCTSLLADVRTKLAASAIEMGAIHKQDLTADVTHLIVGSIATPKYRYVAKHRPDIAVLRAEWIDAVKAVWMNGDDEEDPDAFAATLAALEREYALPPFFGLQISITGFEDVEQRAQIEATVGAKGGLYSGDMTRATTHLIVADVKAPSAKYTHAKQWNILTVSYKWFEDSITRGMALDESLYAPELPLEQQGIGAFRPPMENPRSVLGKRGRGDVAANTRSGDAGGRRKLRKATSMRLEGHSQDLWQGISAHEIQVETTELNAWEDESQTLRTDRRPEPRQDAQSSTTVTNPSHPAPAADTGLFGGYYLLMHGFDARRMAKIRQFTEPNGATFVDSPAALSHASTQENSRHAVLLVPHTGTTTLPTIPPGTLTATEFWIERCLHHKRLLDPTTDVLSRPIAPLRPAGAAAGLVVTSTGFSGPDLLHVAKAITALGAVYEQVLSPAASVLVCGGGSAPELAAKKEKLYYAAKHQIPVVGAEWLWATLREGQREPFGPHRLTLPAFDVAAMTGSGNGGARAASPGSGSASASASGSAEKQKSESTSFKRLSATRKRPMTPALAFEKVAVGPASAAMAAASAPVPSKATSSTTRPASGKRAGGSSKGPFILEDDDDDDDNHDDTCDVPMPGGDENTSSGGRAEASSTTTATTAKAKPLSEISPNVSQRSEPALSQQPSDPSKQQKPTKQPPPETDHAEPDSAASNPATSTTAPAPIPGLIDPVQALALLRAKQRDARCPSDGQPPPKRKNRLLGRNSSWISNPSLDRPASPAEAPSFFSPSQQQDPASARLDRTPELLSLPPQGTQLAYEVENSDDTEAKRRALGRKLGCVELESEKVGGSREGGEGTRRAVVRDSEVVAVQEARRERRARVGRR